MSLTNPLSQPVVNRVAAYAYLHPELSQTTLYDISDYINHNNIDTSYHAPPVNFDSNLFLSQNLKNVDLCSIHEVVVDSYRRAGLLQHVIYSLCTIVPVFQNGVSLVGNNTFVSVADISPNLMKVGTVLQIDGITTPSKIVTVASVNYTTRTFVTVGNHFPVINADTYTLYGIQVCNVLRVANIGYQRLCDASIIPVYPESFEFTFSMYLSLHPQANQLLGATAYMNYLFYIGINDIQPGDSSPNQNSNVIQGTLICSNIQSTGISNVGPVYNTGLIRNIGDFSNSGVITSGSLITGSLRSTNLQVIGNVNTNGTISVLGGDINLNDQGSLTGINNIFSIIT
jgi:hypothetical protein